MAQLNSAIATVAGATTIDVAANTFTDAAGNNNKTGNTNLLLMEPMITLTRVSMGRYVSWCIYEL